MLGGEKPSNVRRLEGIFVMVGKSQTVKLFGLLFAFIVMVMATGPVAAHDVSGTGPRALPGSPGGGMVAEQQRVYWTIYRGTDYIKADDHTKAVYVAGVLDALNMAVRTGFVAGWLQECAAGREATDVAELFGDWLNENLTKQSEPAAMLIFMALGDECAYPMPSALR